MPDTAPVSNPVRTSAIPPVPLTLYDSDFAEFSRKLGASFERYGFAVLGGHGIDPALLSRVDAATRAFFALPEEVKLKYHRRGQGGARGYTPFGVETAKGYSAHDLKEFYHVGRDLPAGHAYRDHMADNIWPDEVRDFHAATYELYETLDALGKKVLRAIAVYLGLDREFFTPLVKDGNSVLRLLHYPPVNQPGERRARRGRMATSMSSRCCWAPRSRACNCSTATASGCRSRRPRTASSAISATCCHG